MIRSQTKNSRKIEMLCLNNAQHDETKGDVVRTPPPIQYTHNYLSDAAHVSCAIQFAIPGQLFLQRSFTSTDGSEKVSSIGIVCVRKTTYLNNSEKI